MNNGSSRYTISVVRDYLNLLKETLNCLEVHCLKFYRKVHRNSGFSHRNLELLNHLTMASKKVSE